MLLETYYITLPRKLRKRNAHKSKWNDDDDDYGGNDEVMVTWLVEHLGFLFFLLQFFL